MFRLRTRRLALLGALMLCGYSIFIALLMQFQSDSIELKREVLLCLAFTMTLGRLSARAGIVNSPHRNVSKKTEELVRRYVELKTALQRISDMTIRDELTGVHNRRYLLDRIAEESHRCTRNGPTFCVGMVDIDLFKRINDIYGHLSGDDVLRTLPTQRQKHCWKLIFGRFGG